MFTVLLAVVLCASAYGFLSAYALKTIRQEQLAARQNHLRLLNRQRLELARQAAALNQAARFVARAQELGLQRNDWAFYDVNVQAPLEYEAAQEIIAQCSDSSAAYFWPLSLELKVPEQQQGKTAAPSQTAMGGPADVQLMVKGRFVARQR